jgi:hypothetical protein
MIVRRLQRRDEFLQEAYGFTIGYIVGRRWRREGLFCPMLLGNKFCNRHQNSSDDEENRHGHNQQYSEKEFRLGQWTITSRELAQQNI